MARRRFLYERDELYNLRNDPQELNNRIDDPSLASVRQDLQEQLLDFLLYTGMSYRKNTTAGVDRLICLSSGVNITGKRMLANENHSFDKLFLEHWSQVYRLLVRLVGDPAEAEDLALETFLRLYQRPPVSGNGLNLGGWLHRVATNLGLTSIRSRQRRRRYELEAGKGALEEALAGRPVEVQADEEERLQAQAALARMNDRQAQLLILRYSGLPYKEIAAVLGVSPTSIGPLLVRAEREFEKQVLALKAEDV